MNLESRVRFLHGIAEFCLEYRQDRRTNPPELSSREPKETVGVESAEIVSTKNL